MGSIDLIPVLAVFVGYMSQNKKLSSARVLENYSNACNVMSLLHECVVTFVVIEKSLCPSSTLTLAWSKYASRAKSLVMNVSLVNLSMTWAR